MGESLVDAEQCVSLGPGFVKGDKRAVTALRAVSRPVEAVSMLKRAPSNDPIECALAQAKAHLAQDSLEVAADGLTMSWWDSDTPLAAEDLGALCPTLSAANSSHSQIQ